MRVLEKVADMREACAMARSWGKLGLVPTMGALHEGHLSLVRAARRECDGVAVSIFVNPAQFAPNEDFARYPRTFDKDCSLLEREGVHLIFAPSADEMYPRGAAATVVDVGELGERLDGKFRPGHFRGVATVVAKLFHIVSPDVAFFGQKDAAQLAVLRAMVRDLNFPVQLAVCPTVREADGLALSSRNRNLNAQERTEALALWRALTAVCALTESGVADAGTLREAMLRALRSSPGVKVEYAEVVDPATLEPVVDVRGGALVAIAAHVGATRLIDNIVLPALTKEGGR
jgi:pantoate--beta-alanine ligase